MRIGNPTISLQANDSYAELRRVDEIQPQAASAQYVMSSEQRSETLIFGVVEDQLVQCGHDKVQSLMLCKKGKLETPKHIA